jgi:ubiquitin carboxyl-terminal hydrolase L5
MDYLQAIRPRPRHRVGGRHWDPGCGEGCPWRVGRRPDTWCRVRPRSFLRLLAGFWKAWWLSSEFRGVRFRFGKSTRAAFTRSPSAMDATAITPPNPAGPSLASDALDDKTEHDLIGGPFAVIESDPGVFTTLVRTLGAQGLQVVELYDIEPWASDHLHPIYGLVFCFLWRKDNDVLPKKKPDGSEDGEDDSAKLWFANQLSDDACASMAILNVLLNVEEGEVDVGERLREFRNETERMSSPVRRAPISLLVGYLNPVAVDEGAGGFKCPFHSTGTQQSRSVGASTPSPPRLLNWDHPRPADIRGATNALAIKTLEDTAKAERSMKPPPAKRRKLATPKRKKPVNPDADLNQEEAYHFIGYVPFRGKVWELDGLKSGPVEVGEVPAPSSPSGSGAAVHRNWMDVVRPVLRMKMRKYGGGDVETGSIRFNLLAIAKDQFCKLSDQLELLKRERNALERQLKDAYPQGWHDKVCRPSLFEPGTFLIHCARC